MGHSESRGTCPACRDRAGDRWVSDSKGTLHLVTGPGDQVEQHSVMRVWRAVCTVRVAERVPVDRCSECRQRAGR